MEKRKFELPIVTEMNIADTSAGFFSNGSGEDYIDESENWTVKTSYKNHNSGSHSEVEIHLHYNGKETGTDTISMKFVALNGLKLDYVKDSGGKFITNVTEEGFILTDSFHHNPGENVKFNIQVVVKNGPVHNGHHGAAGVTGVFQVCDFVCKHYTIA